MTFRDRKIKVFSVLYRDENIQSYNFENVLDTIRLSDEFNYTGLLLFQSNRGNLEPWVFAQSVLSNSATLSPFIAVNPVYMHPFTAARKILSLGSLYQRKIYLNFITGTSKSDMANLNDFLEHDQRYQRLTEYIQVVRHLLTDRKTLRFKGEYYTVNDLQLSDKLPAEILPEFFIAGSSESARKANAFFGSSSFGMAKDMQQLPSDSLKPPAKQALHFGIVARPDANAAWYRMKELFSGDEVDRAMLDYSMGNTDSNWKKELHETIQLTENRVKTTYSLFPFEHFKADCPYHAGSYEEVADVLVQHIMNGVDCFVIEIPSAGEFFHVNKVFQLCRSIIQDRFAI